MYELPEWEEGKEYWSIHFDARFSKWEVTKVPSGLYEVYINCCALFLIFATRELAQIEAERRKAENKLRNLAEEREKEFPLSLGIMFFVPRFYRVGLSVLILDADSITVNDICFSGFASKKEFYFWLLSIMSESEIKALCMSRRYL